MSLPSLFATLVFLAGSLAIAVTATCPYQGKCTKPVAPKLSVAKTLEQAAADLAKSAGKLATAFTEYPEFDTFYKDNAKLSEKLKSKAADLAKAAHDHPGTSAVERSYVDAAFRSLKAVHKDFSDEFEVGTFCFPEIVTAGQEVKWAMIKVEEFFKSESR